MPGSFGSTGGGSTGPLHTVSVWKPAGQRLLTGTHSSWQPGIGGQLVPSHGGGAGGHSHAGTGGQALPGAHGSGAGQSHTGGGSAQPVFVTAQSGPLQGIGIGSSPQIH